MKNGNYINIGAFILFLMLFYFLMPESFGKYGNYSVGIMMASLLMGAVFIAVDRKRGKDVRWKKSMSSIEWIAIFSGLVSIFFRSRGDFYYLEYLLPVFLGIKFGEIGVLKILGKKKRDA